MNAIKRRFDDGEYQSSMVEYYLYTAPSKEMYGKEMHGWGLSWRTKERSEAETVFDALAEKGAFVRMVTVKKTIVDVRECGNTEEEGQ